MSNTTLHKIQTRFLIRRIWEKIFRVATFLSVCLAGGFLIVLIYGVFVLGAGAFVTYHVRLPVNITPQTLHVDSYADVRKGDFSKALREALYAQVPQAAHTRTNRRLALRLLSPSASARLRAEVLALSEPVETISFSAPLSGEAAQLFKGGVRRTGLRDKQIEWLQYLQDEKSIERVWDVGFLTNGDSSEPEQAGLASGLMGSLYLMLVTFLISFPIGVGGAAWLEFFAPKGKLTRFIETNIANLAAAPSIIFGLLGLAIYINLMGLPRSAPLVGGMTLALMTLPTIAITTRSALRAVSPSLREAALAMGASPMQALLHHILPAAMPGILTGAIIGMAQALGESAPLLMIGMTAFVVDPPHTPLDAATSLPTQIYLWAEQPGAAFSERAAGAIIVLLVFLIGMNALAVLLRKRFEK